MRQKKKVEKAIDGLKAFLEKQGVAIDNIKTDEITDVKWHRSLEAEGILISLDSDRLQFTARACKQCGEIFATNYRAVAYCTDACRKRALEKFGIIWDPTKTAQQRWGWNENMPSQLPIIISPTAIQVLEKFFDRVQESRNQIEMAQAEEQRRIRILNETPAERTQREAFERSIQTAYGPEIERQLTQEPVFLSVDFPSEESNYVTLPVVHPLTSGLPQGNNSADTNPPESLPSDSVQLIPVDFPEF